MPARQQLCTCIMVTFQSEWDDYSSYSVPLLLMSWRCGERGHQQPFLLIYSNPSNKRLFLDFLFNFRGECKCGLATFGTETNIRLLIFSWLEGISNIKRHINWLSDKSIITVKSCVAFNGVYCQKSTCVQSYPSEWLNSSILSVHCLYMISMFTNCKMQLDGPEPAFDKASDLRVIHLWSSCETFQHRAHGNINSLMVKYIEVWNRILSQNI